MADPFGRPDEGEYKLVTISILGLVTETFSRGWAAETWADVAYRAAKEDDKIHYVVLFHGPNIRWEHPKLTG